MAHRPDPFTDREQAGRVLAGRLLGSGEMNGREPVLVLALPRGGVPVAAPIAAALGAALDVLVVRKLGLPRQPELAMGAIAGVGKEVELLRNEAVLAAFEVPEDVFEQVRQRELRALREREAFFRAGRPAVAIRDRWLVLVDDGLATGSTMRAAVAAAHRQQPAGIVVAVPVAAPQICARIRREVDAVVCVHVPVDFVAVGAAYRDFRAPSDEDVREILLKG